MLPSSGQNMGLGTPTKSLQIHTIQYSVLCMLFLSIFTALWSSFYNVVSSCCPFVDHISNFSHFGAAHRALAGWFHHTRSPMYVQAVVSTVVGSSGDLVGLYI